MLAPSNRLTLIEAMRPPPGFQLESAMAVTFTLNLQTLLAVPAAFTITGLDESEDDGAGARPVELIHALRMNADKLTVFSEAGYISLPPASRALGFLERAVVPVSAPEGGIVHPKVWVLRYQEATDGKSAEAAAQRLRVLISSRNLTFDPSWDTMLRLDETPSSKGIRLEAVGELFTGLLDMTITEAAGVHQRRVQSLVQALETARFGLPEGVGEVRIHVLGNDRTGKSAFPNNPDRCMIISPFLTDGFFTSVYSGPVNTLVSRQKALDGLSDEILGKIGSKYVFDDGDSVETPDQMNAAQSRTLTSDDPGRPLRGLHAKVFVFEKGQDAYLFIGSANATGAAFFGNVEILAELRGPTAQLGIKRLLEGDDDQPGLLNLFYEYRRGCDTTNGPGEMVLDQIRRAIASMQIRGIVEKAGADHQEWTVTYRGATPMPEGEGVEISCWPVTSPGHRRGIDQGMPLEAHFATTLEKISGFLAFELLHADGEQTGFVVPVRLEGVPEHRDRSLLKALIGDARRFLRYLLALLYEDSAGHDVGEVVRHIGRSESEADGNALRLAVLEKLLRTMRTDPHKLAGLHPLITDLRADDALPPGFAELWDAIYDVAIADVVRS